MYAEENILNEPEPTGVIEDYYTTTITVKVRTLIHTQAHLLDAEIERIESELFDQIEKAMGEGTVADGHTEL